MRRTAEGAYKTGLIHEIELLEEMRRHVNTTISNLSPATGVPAEELIRLKSQGARLLNVVEKALLKRQIALLLEDLERRRPILRSFNQEYEALIDLRMTPVSGVGVALNVQSPPSSTTRPMANVSSEDFLTELRRVREQIFRALGELNESGEVK